MFRNSGIGRNKPGPPRIRLDEETCERIANSAAACFRINGFSDVCMSDIAKTAGISTRTLYRLFAGKNELLAHVISTHVKGNLSERNLELLGGMNLRGKLTHLMTAYGMLTLSSDAIWMTRLALEASALGPEFKSAFHECAVDPANLAIEQWLRVLADTGQLRIRDPIEAGAILRGMMIMEPQRTSLLGQQEPLGADEVAARAAYCVSIFLTGLAAKARSNTADA
jgi:AcrR family transcriptional regulator